VRRELKRTDEAVIALLVHGQFHMLPAATQESRGAQLYVAYILVQIMFAADVSVFAWQRHLLVPWYT
jgi:hypothetical protein